MLSIPCGSPTSKVVCLPPPPPPSSWLWAVTAVSPASRRTQEIRAASRFMAEDSLMASHQMPVEKALEAPVEVDLRAGPQEAVRLGRIGHVLEGLAEPPERLHQLLGLLRAHALVALAVRYQERRLDVLEAVIRRARDVGLARLRRRAHHALEVLDAVAVALGPGGRDVAVTVLGHRAAEAVLGVVRHGRERHVGPVARAEDAEPLAVDPVERPQVVRRGQAVLRVVHAPDAVAQPPEVAAVPRGPAEVDREPGVALVHEVLRLAVPLVRVRVRRASVRVYDRGHRRFGGRAARAHQERRD